nr:reverse transcriptase domain-containing protein [Tanacetum cinerariifolium]
MVKEGIVLGHKISKNGIEVDKAKVDVIAKLPHPTTVKRGVFTARKPLTFSRLATIEPPGDVMARTTPPKSDRKMHFCNDQFAKVMLKYGVTHRLATAYHHQTSGQAFRTTYKTPIGCTSNKLIYEKACHLSIELEHKAYWALKHANFNLQTAGDHKKFQLNESNELRDQAYENSLIYKEKTKRLHYSKIKDRVFNVGDRVLLFNSRLKIFSGKLKTHWSGPFTITHVFHYGTVELSQTDGPNFKEDFKGITTQSGNACQGPTIPTTSYSLPKVVEREADVTKDTVHPTNNGSTKDVQPSVSQVETPILNSEPVVAPIIEPLVAPESRKPSSSGEQPRKKPILPRRQSWSKPASSLSSTGLLRTGLSSTKLPSSGSSTSDSSTMNTASSLGSGTLLSNTITNPKEDFKGITTQSGNACQ